MILCVAPSPDDKRIYALRGLSPGGVHRAAAVTRCAAGKGVNAARALASMGTDTALLSFAGPSFHLLLAAELAASLELIVVPTAHETRSCVTLRDGADATETEIVQEAAAVEVSEAGAFLTAARSAVARATVVLFAGSIPGGCPANLYADLIREAGGRGIPTVLDAHGHALLAALPSRPTVVKINADEAIDALARLRGADVVPHGRAAATEAAMEALCVAGARAVAISDGAHPIRVRSDAGDIMELLPPVVEVISAIGCGDAMSAGIALGLARGDDLRDALALGAAMGTAAAMTALPGALDSTAVGALRAEIIPRTAML
jgi:tagatose 6-phosphate kinase